MNRITRTVDDAIGINIESCGNRLLRFSVHHLRPEESACFADTSIGHLLLNHERQRASFGIRRTYHHVYDTKG